MPKRSKRWCHRQVDTELDYQLGSLKRNQLADVLVGLLVWKETKSTCPRAAADYCTKGTLIVVLPLAVVHSIAGRVYCCQTLLIASRWSDSAFEQLGVAAVEALDQLDTSPCRHA